MSISIVDEDEGADIFRDAWTVCDDAHNHKDMVTVVEIEIAVYACLCFSLECS